MEKVTRKNYPTDLTDLQWAKIEPLFVGMRKRKFEKRELVNAVLYLVKTLCQWRNLPHDFPNWKTVYSFFMRAAKNGLWSKIVHHLTASEPCKVIIDSQSAKTTSAAVSRGFDGGKKQKGASDISSQICMAISLPSRFILLQFMIQNPVLRLPKMLLKFIRPLRDSVRMAVIAELSLLRSINF